MFIQCIYIVYTYDCETILICANTTHPAGNILHWSRLQQERWKIYIATTQEGLCYVSPHDAPFEQLATWTSKHLPSHTLVQDDFVMQPYAVALSEYFAGNLQQFNLTVHNHGTAFGANPLLIVVPSHRVIGKNGQLTGFRGALEMKKQLLALKIMTSEQRKVSIHSARW